MSFDFTIYNQNFTNPFEYEIPKGTPFVQLMDLDENRLYRLRQIYINPKAKYGPHPVAGIEFNNEYNALWVSPAGSYGQGRRRFTEPGRSHPGYQPGRMRFPDP